MTSLGPPGDCKPYWTLVGNDHFGNTMTYEHRLPHGTLVMVRCSGGDGPSCTLCFVPPAPHPGQERP